MRSSTWRNNFSGGGRSRKNFFGGTKQNNFFGSAGNAAQLQSAPKLPEFSQTNYTNNTFAFFDTNYNVKGPLPAIGTLSISHGVHMKYPSSMTKDERSAFESNFIKSVHDGWSGKHMLGLAEPGFATYLCDVEVNTYMEDDPKKAHTVTGVVKPKPTDKRFTSRVSGVAGEEGTKTTHKASLDHRDPSVEKTNKISEADFIQHVGNFDFDSDVINADCREDIDKIKSFIQLIPGSTTSGKDAFDLRYVGRASSDGSAAHNQKLSERRVAAVEKELGIFPGLGITIAEFGGEEEAAESPDFRRVNVGVFGNNNDKATSTPHNVAAHEFGHMIGLGDEYIDTKPEVAGSRIKYFGDQPTHYDLVKEVVDENAANELLIQDSANVMSLGNEVKRGHYAFFVAALDLMTRPEIEKATGKKDAKWIVF